MAFDVLKYIKEKETNTDNGRSSTYYQDRYDYLTKNAMDFYEQYGKTEYDRYANYYGTKAQIERYGINQNDFAPSYALLDDLIENRSQYNEKDWKSTYAMADSLVKSESSNLNAAFKMKEKGLYSADLLNSYDWMSQWGYTDDPEDVMRQKLGYAPIALDNAAKDIVKRAEEYKEADRKKNLTPEEKIAELNDEIMPEKTGWTVFESANAPITEEELREAIKVLGEGQIREKEQRQAILQNPLTPMTTKEYAARQLYAQGTGVQNRSTDERENPIISATVGTDGGTYDLNSLVQDPAGYLKNQRDIGVRKSYEQRKTKEEYDKYLGDTVIKYINWSDVDKGEIKPYEDLYAQIYGKTPTSEDLKALSRRLDMSRYTGNVSNIDPETMKTLENIATGNSLNFISGTGSGTFMPWDRVNPLNVQNNYNATLDKAFKEATGKTVAEITGKDVSALTYEDLQALKQGATDQDKEFLERAKVILEGINAENIEKAKAAGKNADTALTAAGNALDLSGFKTSVEGAGSYIMQGLGAVADLAGGNNAKYWQNWREYNAEKEKIQKQVDRVKLEATKDYKPWVGTAVDIGSGISNTAASIMLGNIAGGVAAAIGGGATTAIGSGAAMLENPAISKGVIDTVMPNPTLKVMFVEQFGNSLNRFEEKGVENAPALALLESTVLTYIEGMGGIAGEEGIITKGLSSMPKNKLAAFAKNWAVTSIEELGEESAQSLVSGAIDATTGTPFMDSDSIKQWTDPQQLANMGISVAIMSGLFGLGGLNVNTDAATDAYLKGDIERAAQLTSELIQQNNAGELDIIQQRLDAFINEYTRQNPVDAALERTQIWAESGEQGLRDARTLDAALDRFSNYANDIQAENGELSIPEIPTTATREAAETQRKPAGVVNADESALPVHARNDLGPTSNNIISESAQNVNAQSTRDAIDTINSKILSENIKDTKLVKTIMKALDIKPPIDAKFKADLEAMASTYQTTDNKTQKKIAKQFVERNFENAERYIKESAVIQTAADAAIVSEIVDKYRQTGRADEALAMIRQTANKFSKAGQFVQSAAIWSKMTPEGVIKGIERAIEKANAHTEKQFALDVKDGKYIMDAVDRSASMDAQELSDLFIEIAKKRGRKLGKATYGELESLVKKNDTATLKNAVIQNLTLTVMDKVPRSLGQKTSTIQAFGHLISAKTAIRNIASNTIFKYQEMVADYSAVIFDMFMSLKTKQRTVAAPSPKNIRQSTEAGLEYARRSMFEIQTGVSLDDAQGKYDLFSLETFPTNKVRGRIERLLGYELKTPDQFAKGAVEISEIRKQLALQGVDVDGKTIDEIVELADKETVEIAKEQALYNTFQNNGFIAGSMREFKKLLNRVGINKGDFGLGDLMIKYPVVPGNLIQRGIDYTPIGALKILRYIGKKNITRTQQRYMAKAFGRAVTGTTMIAIGCWLTYLGVIVSPPDDNKREKAFFEDAGLSGRKLNISAVGRLLEGEEATIQDGDTLLSFDFLETVNAHLSIGHEIAKNIDKPENLPKKIIGTYGEEILDMPMMSVINSMVYERMKEDSTWVDVAAVPFIQAIPGFIPAPIRQAAAAADSFQRDHKGIVESIMFNTPARESLPAKLGTFGQELKQDSGVIQFFNPGKSSTYLPLKFTKELKRLADKYSDYEIYPSGVTVKAFNLNGKRYELNEVEQRGFMTLYGDMLADSYDIILTSSLSDDEKISKLKEYQTVIKNYVKDHYAFKKGD